jgi:hypothetical protein
MHDPASLQEKDFLPVTGLPRTLALLYFSSLHNNITPKYSFKVQSAMSIHMKECGLFSSKLNKTFRVAGLATPTMTNGSQAANKKEKVCLSNSLGMNQQTEAAPREKESHPGVAESGRCFGTFCDAKDIEHSAVTSSCSVKDVRAQNNDWE